MGKPLTGFKWTNADGYSWHDGKFGPWVAGATLAVENPTDNGEPCGNGIHIGKTAADAIGYGRFPGRLYSVRGVGQVYGEDDTKFRVGKVSVLKEMPKPSWVIETEAFIESIKTVAFFNPRRGPLKAWRHSAAESAAESAAWSAARSAAESAAGSAAGSVAGSAARSAAGSAARSAARSAAWDAGLMAQLAIVSDRKFQDAERHRKHARARWKVWQMGYGLLCDVDGVLYTYEKP